MGSLLRGPARLLLGWLFVKSGIDVLRKPGPRAVTAAPTLAALRAAIPSLPANDVLLVRANALVQLICGALLVIGPFRRLAALALAASLVPTTIGGHPYWRHDDPRLRAQHKVHFDKHVALIGGLLYVAGSSR
jgi:uncharacterized membrane protein YphA (DoxX/SURF4 family)